MKGHHTRSTYRVERLDRVNDVEKKTLIGYTDSGVEALWMTQRAVEGIIDNNGETPWVMDDWGWIHRHVPASNWVTAFWYGGSVRVVRNND